MEVRTCEDEEPYAAEKSGQERVEREGAHEQHVRELQVDINKASSATALHCQHGYGCTSAFNYIQHTSACNDPTYLNSSSQHRVDEEAIYHLQQTRMCLIQYVIWVSFLVDPCLGTQCSIKLICTL